MKRYWQVLATLLAIACATVPSSTPIERAARDAEKCLQNGPCFVVQTSSAILERAVVSLNGVKIGELAGFGSATFFVNDSRLVNGRCARVFVRLVGSRDFANTEEACLSRGGYFRLDVTEQRVWLTALVTRDAE
jgi:hypothetical protein